MSTTQTFALTKTHTIKRILFFTFGIACLAFAIFSAIALYGPSGVIHRPGYFTSGNISGGRALVAPLFFGMVGIFLCWFAWAGKTTRTVRLDGSILTMVYGRSSFSVDLSKLASAGQDPVYGKFPRVVRLRDTVGGGVSLNLGGFKPQDIAWLRQPLQSALQRPGVVQDRWATKSFAKWFKD